MLTQTYNVWRCGWPFRDLAGYIIVDGSPNRRSFHLHVYIIYYFIHIDNLQHVYMMHRRKIDGSLVMHAAAAVDFIDGSQNRSLRTSSD